MKADLSVKIGALKLKNPVMTASGTFGPEYGELIDINSLGAVVLKTITIEERRGNPPPRIAETASGMLNSIGLENKGLDYFLKNKNERLKKISIPVIVSIAGNDKSEYVLLAKTLSRARGIDAIEINLSCPNVKHGLRHGLIAQDADEVYNIVEAVRKASRLTLIAKLSPNVTDIVKIALSAEKAGADAVLISNTFPAMAVDVETKKPKLGNITGGLSGPAIKPIVLKLVWDAHSKIKIPIIGSGGIMCCDDAIEFILCGASAIQVGTASFINPSASQEIIKGLSRYCMENGVKNIGMIVGSIKEGVL